jgi:hypothetical protein
MTTNNAPARRVHNRLALKPDYELHHYRTGSEIRAVYCDKGDELVAEFPSIHEAEVAWEQVVWAINAPQPGRYINPATVNGTYA